MMREWFADNGWAVWLVLIAALVLAFWAGHAVGFRTATPEEATIFWRIAWGKCTSNHVRHLVWDDGPDIRKWVERVEEDIRRRREREEAKP